MRDGQKSCFDETKTRGINESDEWLKEWKKSEVCQKEGEMATKEFLKQRDGGNQGDRGFEVICHTRTSTKHDEKGEGRVAWGTYTSLDGVCV